MSINRRNFLKLGVGFTALPFVGKLFASEQIEQAISLQQATPLPIIPPKPFNLADRYPTGFPQLDEVLGGGFKAGTLNAVGGGPSCGKSTMIRQIAKTADHVNFSTHEYGYGYDYDNLELKKTEILTKAILRTNCEEEFYGVHDPNGPMAQRAMNFLNYSKKQVINMGDKTQIVGLNLRKKIGAEKYGNYFSSYFGGSWMFHMGSIIFLSRNENDEITATVVKNIHGETNKDKPIRFEIVPSVNSLKELGV